jgi:hypothetical protein
VPARQPADEQLQRITHRSQVCTEIDRVREKQERNDNFEQPVRVVPADIAGKPAAGYAADPSADLLDRHHQRIGEQHSPANAKPKLRAGLAVCPYTRRIVIRGSGDQTGAEGSQKTRL